MSQRLALAEQILLTAMQSLKLGSNTRESCYRKSENRNSLRASEARAHFGAALVGNYVALFEGEFGGGERHVGGHAMASPFGK